MSVYDEDINSNPFFQLLCTEYKTTLDRAVQHGWLICVPCRQHTADVFQHHHVLCHILVPDTCSTSVSANARQQDELWFSSLTEHRVKKHGNTLQLSSDSQLCETNAAVTPDSDQHRVCRILFAETVYTESMSSYTIWCIDAPLMSTAVFIKSVPTDDDDDGDNIDLQSLADCLNVLWCLSPSSHEQQSLLSVNSCCSEFAGRLSLWPAPSTEQLVDATFEVFSRALAMFFSSLRADVSPIIRSRVSLAIETYVVCSLYDRLLEKLLPLKRQSDSAINCAVQRTGNQLQPRHLSVKQHYSAAINRASFHLNTLGRQRHPLGKYTVLRRVVRELSSGEDGGRLTSDDLIAMFILAICRSQITDWSVQLIILKCFHVCCRLVTLDEYSFLVTTLEAAVRHIDSGALGVHRWSRAMECDQLTMAIEDCGHCTSHQQSQLFRMIVDDDVDGVARAIDNSDTQPRQLPLCHPLCDCSECRQRISALQAHSSLEQARDQLGRTVIHMAARYGSSACLQLLLSRDSVASLVNCGDYRGFTPAHHAALHDQQMALLLLLQAAAAIDLRCQLGQTPLHVASATAHQRCVAALLNVLECRGGAHLSFVVNLCDLRGDTALHLAARYGHDSIIQLLMEHGANARMTNRRRLTPLDVAHDVTLRHKMQRLRCIQRDTVSQKLMPVIPTRPTDSHYEAIEGGVMERCVRRLFSAIAAGDERLACYYLDIEFDLASDKPPSAQISRSVCAGRKCVPLTATCSGTGRTPLHAALTARLIHLTRLLLTAGGSAVLEARDREGGSPLHSACAADFSVGCRILIMAGADLNSLDERGGSPLHTACMKGSHSCVDRLISAGCDVNVQNCDGHTALDMIKLSAEAGASGKIMADLIKRAQDLILTDSFREDDSH